MLSHSHPQAHRPARIVVLGGGGFIAGAIRRRLEADGTVMPALGWPAPGLLAPDAVVHDRHASEGKS